MKIQKSRGGPIHQPEQSPASGADELGREAGRLEVAGEHGPQHLCFPRTTD
jgi:hypothetical protein